MPAPLPPAGSLDLSPLYQHCLFRSDAQVESHDQVARELSDHDLHWRQGAVDTAMYKAGTRRMAMFALRYGAEVEVRPRPFQDFALVHLSLRGGTEIEADGVRISVPQGRTALIAPRRSIRMWWERGSEQFILKVPHSLLHAGDPASPEALDLPSAALLSTPHEGPWRSLVQSLVHTTALPHGSPAHGAWVDHFERTVALFLRTHSGPDSAPLAPPAPPAARQAITLSGASAGARLEAMEAYMRRRLAAPIALVDLAQAAGVSVRTLTLLCQRHRGSTPMDLLRAMRLDAVRAHLQSDPQASVTTCALEYGFGHLGRFSAYYRERFGELPSETRPHRH
ncbi:AraC family transcriptional regulator [Curvibacter sp. HBC61]|uniref:AraC family transcriptional regulator n=1 Tax=Curvibacter cyanobacteriorum TaxID=3026422 RepID=A0ABT5MXD3_9BURK|nr:AraC family transcriptional regulator [Curvibacter sp. HBC61]MDD0838709.1 AraC family transcriptional regulator [Curvibacter sp. HBC61]